MSTISNLEPKKVFTYFEEISKIPRCSGKEQEISDYLVAFGKQRNLEVRQDDAKNVVIKKPGTAGYENAPAVIIQGHMDMVCEKNFDSNHNFDTDPIKLLIDGDYVTADGTTLGADNGIAIAYSLALLDSEDIAHPPLEIIVTTDEETGMSGALAIDASDLKGKLLINLDSEEEGEILVSCAGGVKAGLYLPIVWDDFDKPEYEGYKVLVKGLKGGHSGADIHLNRANANKLIGRVLFNLNQKLNFKLADICGGSQDNAIPREAYIVLHVEKTDLEDFDETINTLRNEIGREFRTSDSDIKIEVSKVDELSNKVIADNTLDQLIYLLMTLPNGIQTMSADIEGLVESSLNLGVLQRDDEKIKLAFAIRSSVKSLKLLMKEQLRLFANQSGAEFIIRGDYPEWEYKKDSKLRDIFSSVYERMYDKKPLIKALHAGLECGVFAEKIEGIDMVSVGPNLFDVHTPDEKLSISSTSRTWDYLLEVLKEIK